jgi:uncharacterized protein YbaR (Trm112 family)
MKTANSQAVIIYLFCPHCDGPLECRRTGVVSISADVASENGWRDGDTVQCDECKRPYRLPAILKNMA